METPKRVAYWDNVKCFLMLLVVIGHAVEEMISLPWCRAVHILIYSFHMPAFVFVSGYFSRTGRNPWKRIFFLIVIGLLFRFTVLSLRIVSNTYESFSLTNINDISWYMFALAFYSAFVWVFRNVNARFLFWFSILFSLFCGYDSEIGLQFQKTAAHLPFFLLGRLFQKDPCVSKGMTELYHSKRAKMISFIMALLAVYVSIQIILIDNRAGSWQLSRKVNAVLWNFDYGNYAPRWGIIVRMTWYAVSILIGFSVCRMIPEKRLCFFTEAGQHTLQIFFWHRLIQYVLSGTGVCRTLSANVTGQLLWLAVSAGVFVLTSTPFFSFPIHSIQSVLFVENEGR